ncbi:MAG: serine protease [Oscillospiraceae bacterium]|nr:serine protease [Oscillospiraceae bacterium]
MAAVSAIAIVTASSVPVSAVGYFQVFGGSNSCNSNSGSNNCNVSVSSNCPSFSDINAILKAFGLENIFGNYTGCQDNNDNCANTPGTGNGAESGSGSNSCDTGDCAAAPGTGASKPDTTPSKPDTSKPSTDTSKPGTDDSSVSDYEKKVVELVNVERAKYGLSPLTLNTKLSAVARAKSQDMKDKQYFSHTSPTYGSPFDMMKSFGISYKTAGENIAMGYRTPEAVVTGWMNSEGHRANILNASFKEIGVGHVVSGNYWTQMFIG